VLAPCTTLWLAGEAESAKFGGGLTTKVTNVLCVSVPLVPVMVSA
jgi:hypothetical protein